MTSFSDITNQIDTDVDDDATDDVLPELDAVVRPKRRFFRSKSSVLRPPQRLLEGTGLGWRRSRSMSTGATPADDDMMTSSSPSLSPNTLSSSNPNCSGGRKMGMFSCGTPPRSPKDLTMKNNTFPRENSTSNAFSKDRSANNTFPKDRASNTSPSDSLYATPPRSPSRSPSFYSSGSFQKPSSTPGSPSFNVNTSSRSPHRWSVSSSPDLYGAAGRRTRSSSSVSMTSTSSSCLSSPGDIEAMSPVCMSPTSPTSPTSPGSRRWSTMSLWSGGATIVRCISKVTETITF